MRVLEQKKIPYTGHSFEDTPSTKGTEIAQLLGVDERKVFKTLVTVGKTGEHYVFVIPVAEELNLKKAAEVSGEKNIAMILQKDLLPLTGYVHGGCSPIGMKKAFKTFFHESALGFDKIFFSAGKIAFQVEVDPGLVIKSFNFRTADLV